MMAATLIALVVLAVIPLYLIFASEYQEGLIGMLALACMSIAAIGKLMLYLAYGATLIAAGTGELMLWAVAVFMARHAYRYWLWSRAGRCGWDEAKACPQAELPQQRGTPTEEEDRTIPYFLRRGNTVAARRDDQLGAP